MWKILVGLQSPVLQQFGRQRTGGDIGYDLIVFAMHDQHRNRDFLEVSSEIGLGERYDPVVMCLGRAHHALAPPILDDRLRGFRTRPVITVEGAGRHITIELRAIGCELGLQAIEHLLGKTERIGRCRFFPKMGESSNRESRPTGQIGCHCDVCHYQGEDMASRVTLLATLAVCAIMGVCSPYVTKSSAHSPTENQTLRESDASPIYGIKIPVGYRDWHLISVKRLTGGGGKLNQLRAELANDIATKAFRDGSLPFPDGSMIAALHWNEASSDADNKVLAEGFPGAGLESTFAGSAVNVQFMVKDSKKFAATGGWGFADFTNGTPGTEALHKTCFPCHQPGKVRDFVFTRYAPTP